MFKTFGFVVMLMLPLASAVQAANLNIQDDVEGQITLAHDANWEFGVNSNGTVFGPFAAGSTTVSGENASFSGSWDVNTGGVPDPGTGIIYFVDQADPTRVSDIVEASWSTVVQSGFDRATITLAIQSSACGADLGPLPTAFAGLGVPDPVSSIGIQSSFRDPATAVPVTIPSNLTIQFVSNDDTDCDNDGVPNGTDLCPNTSPGAVVNADGCSIDQLCPCASQWKNHGAYASCVSQAAGNFVAAGLISAEQKDAIVAQAGASSCGGKK
jgi:hypothetical protein